jgi:hypothetical protein
MIPLDHGLGQWMKRPPTFVEQTMARATKTTIRRAEIDTARVIRKATSMGKQVDKLTAKLSDLELEQIAAQGGSLRKRLKRLAETISKKLAAADR